MNNETQEALLRFMRAVLRELHPNIDEYPLDAIKIIDASEGEDSPKLLAYGENMVRAYYMQKAINTIDRATL